jgi:hypothetical protein
VSRVSWLVGLDIDILVYVVVRRKVSIDIRFTILDTVQARFKRCGHGSIILPRKGWLSVASGVVVMR